MRIFQASLCVLALTLGACGGGSGGSSGSSDNNDNNSGGNSNGGGSMPTVSSGIFVDSTVSGLNFSTATQSGQTDSQGTFQYISGEMITFSIGDIEFPAVSAKSTVTPFDLAGTLDTGNLSLINIVRLLQSLDTDGDPDNGITIGSDAHMAATGATIAFDSPTFDMDMDVVNLVANSGSTNTMLIDGTAAIAHLTSNVNPNTGCTFTHPSIGYVATLTTKGHNVSGTATIVDDCTIALTNFSYDGGGLPNVRVYTGLNGMYADGATISDNLYTQVFDNDTLILHLPAGVTLGSFDGISVWCVEAGASFGDGIFQMP